MNDELTRTRAEKSLVQMYDWIGKHDTRSGALMIITVAMMGALSAAIPPTRPWPPLFVAVIVLAAGGFGFVLLQIMRGIIPRMRTSAKPSLSFFGAIAGMPQEQFHERFVNLSEAEYIEDLLNQIYVNARILRSKFRCLKRAQIGLLLTALPWAVALSLAKTV